MEGTRIPLGIYADRERQPARSVPLERGDILVFLTDGILESAGAGGSPFGVENALALVRERRREPARRILDHLMDEVRRSLGDEPQADDITAVVGRVGEAP